jgi:hypothetical protein
MIQSIYVIAGDSGCVSFRRPNHVSTSTLTRHVTSYFIFAAMSSSRSTTKASLAGQEWRPSGRRSPRGENEMCVRATGGRRSAPPHRIAGRAAHFCRAYTMFLQDVPPILVTTKYYLCNIYREGIYILALMTGEVSAATATNLRPADQAGPARAGLSHFFTAKLPTTAFFETVRGSRRSWSRRISTERAHLMSHFFENDSGRLTAPLLFAASVPPPPRRRRPSSSSSSCTACSTPSSPTSRWSPSAR